MNFSSDEYRREELIRQIEHAVERLTLAELEALYYDMSTKSYINDASARPLQPISPPSTSWLGESFLIPTARYSPRSRPIT